MQFKHLRNAMEELHKARPEIDEAEVRINLGHSLDDLKAIEHFIQKNVVILFPITVPTGTRLPSREEWERMKKEGEGQ